MNSSTGFLDGLSGMNLKNFSDDYSELAASEKSVPQTVLNKNLRTISELPAGLVPPKGIQLQAI